MNKWTVGLILIGIAVGGVACSQSGDSQKKAEAPAQPMAAEKEVPVKAETMVKEAAKAVEQEVAKVEEKVAEVKEKAAAEVEKTVAEAQATVPNATTMMPAEQTLPVVKEMAMGDAAKGAKITKGKCGGCHALDSDRKKVGPTLKGIYGKKPTIEGIPFATWDAAALDAWIKRPKDVKAKTKMAFSGIDDENIRQDIIAYMKTL